jgi:CheY-like chemotaxis protein
VKILIVEKNADRIEIFKQKLSGHETFFAKTASEAIKTLEKNETLDQIFLDNHSLETARWIRNHEKKRPYRIVIHGFSVPGAQNILLLLPEASFIPGVWLLNRMEF